VGWSAAVWQGLSGAHPRRRLMSGWAALAVLAAGVAAGGINAVVGAGTLVTFSTLVTLGIAPLTANVSNTVGLVAGSVAGSMGYRQEISEQRGRLKRLIPASVLGGVVGAALLLVLPSSAFDAIVPALVLLGVVLVIIQPWLSRKLATTHDVHHHVGLVTFGSVFLTGVYGGYFGAAQGVILIAILATLVDQHLQRVNAMKNVLAALVNAVAAVIFIFVAPVDWTVAGLLFVGSTVGGFLGGHYGRRIPQAALRAVIVVVGLIAVAVLVGS
jgi:uncharacterized protein